MKLVLTILVCFVTISTQAQSYDEWIKKGDKFYDNKQYLESGESYNQAFLTHEGNASAYYNAACSWALSNDTIQAINYLNLSADKGWKNLRHIKRDKDLSILHPLQSWDGILIKVQKNLDKFEKDFDKPLKKELEEIYIRDQTLRQLYRDAEEKFGKESDEMIYFWDLVAEQDSLNEMQVIKIIENRGWVGKSIVGKRANAALWLVIQHAPIETQKKYLPLLRTSVLAKESKGSHLALLEDRILMGSGKPQTYGSQITIDKETGKQMVYEIKDPEYVNKRRKEVGLGSIQKYLKRWGIDWTIEQKE